MWSSAGTHGRPGPAHATAGLPSPGSNVNPVGVAVTVADTPRNSTVRASGCQASTQKNVLSPTHVYGKPPYAGSEFVSGGDRCAAGEGNVNSVRACCAKTAGSGGGGGSGGAAPAPPANAESGTYK